MATKIVTINPKSMSKQKYRSMISTRNAREHLERLFG